MSSQANGSSPRLLSLPIELRHQIWYYALQDPFYDPDGTPAHPSAAEANGVLVQPSRTDFWEIYEPYWGLEPMTRLLRTNRQIHDEATAVLYSRFNFHFGADLDCDVLESFFGGIPEQSRQLVRTVSVRMCLGHRSLQRLFKHVSHVAQFRRLMELAPNLQMVTFGFTVYFGPGEAFFDDLQLEDYDGVFLPDPREAMSMFANTAKVGAELMPEYRLRPEAQSRLQTYFHRVAEELNSIGSA